MQIPKNAIWSYGMVINNGKVLVLPITKQYYDKIMDGSKTTEYRKDVPFYHRLLDRAKDADTLILHYRKDIYMMCGIKKIRNIKRPKKLENSKHITTDRCFGIDVINPKPINVKIIE